MKQRKSGTHNGPDSVKDYKETLIKLASKKYDGERLELKISRIKAAKTRTAAKRGLRAEKGMDL